MTRKNYKAEGIEPVPTMEEIRNMVEEVGRAETPQVVTRLLNAIEQLHAAAREPDADALAEDLLTRVMPFIEHAAECAGRRDSGLDCNCGYHLRIDMLCRAAARLRAPTGTPRAVTEDEVERFVSQYLGAEGGGRRTWVRRALEDFLASRSVEAAGGEGREDTALGLRHAVEEFGSHTGGASHCAICQAVVAFDAARLSPPPEKSDTI